MHCQTKVPSWLGPAALTILAPHAYELTSTQEDYPEAEVGVGDVVGAGLWDIISTLDPTGATDLIEYGAGI